MDRIVVGFDLAIIVIISEIIPSGPDAFPVSNRDAESLNSSNVSVEYVVFGKRMKVPVAG